MCSSPSLEGAYIQEYTKVKEVKKMKLILFSIVAMIILAGCEPIPSPVEPVDPENTRGITCAVAFSIASHASEKDYYLNAEYCGQFTTEETCEAVQNEGFCVAIEPTIKE